MLNGVRVLELAIAWAGPLAGRYLADLGAEVICIEAPTARGAGTGGIGGARAAAEVAAWSRGELPGPVFRSGVYPDADPGERPWNRQGVFNKMNRNKRSLCLDLKAPGARDVFVDLVKISDVVLDNFSPRGVQRMGIDYESLVVHRPDLIRISLSGYGHTGPDQMSVSYGPNIESRTGLAAMTGYPDGEAPMKLGTALPDPVGGLHGALAVLAALEARDRTGRGCRIDLSQLETYASIGGELYLAASGGGDPPSRLGNRGADFAPQGVYPALGDDEWLAISVQDDDEWAALVAALDPCPVDADADADERRARHDEIDAAIAAWTRSRDKLEAMATLQERGVRAVAVMRSRDIVESPHIEARGFIVEWDQVDVGRRRFAGFPARFQDPDSIPMSGTPALGADNDYVVRELLGYAPERVSELSTAGALAVSPP